MTYDNAFLQVGRFEAWRLQPDDCAPWQNDRDAAIERERLAAIARGEAAPRTLTHRVRKVRQYAWGSLTVTAGTLATVAVGSWRTITTTTRGATAFLLEALRRGSGFPEVSGQDCGIVPALDPDIVAPSIAPTAPEEARQTTPEMQSSVQRHNHPLADGPSKDSQPRVLARKAKLRLVTQLVDRVIAANPLLSILHDASRRDVHPRHGRRKVAFELRSDRAGASALRRPDALVK